MVTKTSVWFVQVRMSSRRRTILFSVWIRYGNHNSSSKILGWQRTIVAPVIPYIPVADSIVPDISLDTAFRETETSKSILIQPGLSTDGFRSMSDAVA